MPRSIDQIRLFPAIYEQTKARSFTDLVFSACLLRLLKVQKWAAGLGWAVRGGIVIGIGEVPGNLPRTRC